MSRRRIHGQSGKRPSAEYAAWGAMIQRCTNPKHPRWRYYGARGITVCERWRNFLNFLSDLGPRPEGHELDRIDNDGNYEPSNCRWADKTTSRRNRRSSAEVEYSLRKSA